MRHRSVKRPKGPRVQRFVCCCGGQTTFEAVKKHCQGSRHVAWKDGKPKDIFAPKRRQKEEAAA